MSATDHTGQLTLVVLQIGNRRFALPSETVVELAPPVRLHAFPHTSPLIAGVIVRRGRIVPVYDAASVLIGRSSSAQRFYLIARRRADSASDLGAIPVNGECQLASGHILAPESDRPAWIAGRVSLHNESIDVLDFGALASAKPETTESNRAELSS